MHRTDLIGYGWNTKSSSKKQLSTQANISKGASQLRVHLAACRRNQIQRLTKRVCASNITRSSEVGSPGWRSCLLMLSENGVPTLASCLLLHDWRMALLSSFSLMSAFLAGRRLYVYQESKHFPEISRTLLIIFH